MSRLREPLSRLLTPVAGAAILLLILIVINGSRDPQGFTWYGLGQIGNEAGAVALAAVGLTFIILIGGFDLSVGSVISVVNVFAAKQAASGTGAEIKIIVISGYSEEVARGDIVDTADFHFLPKPFSLGQLASKVKEVLAET